MIRLMDRNEIQLQNSDIRDVDAQPEKLIPELDASKASDQDQDLILR